MLKDILGNDLKEGDYVHVTLPSNQVLAKIKEISMGGLLGASAIVNSRAQAMVIPGNVVLEIILNSSFDPKNPQLGVNKAVVPDDSPLLKDDKNKDIKKVN